MAHVTVLAASAGLLLATGWPAPCAAQLIAAGVEQGGGIVLAGPGGGAGHFSSQAGNSASATVIGSGWSGFGSLTRTESVGGAASGTARTTGTAGALAASTQAGQAVSAGNGSPQLRLGEASTATAWARNGSAAATGSAVVGVAGRNGASSTASEAGGTATTAADARAGGYAYAQAGQAAGDAAATAPSRLVVATASVRPAGGTAPPVAVSLRGGPATGYALSAGPLPGGGASTLPAAAMNMSFHETGPSGTLFAVSGTTGQASASATATQRATVNGRTAGASIAVTSQPGRGR